MEKPMSLICATLKKLQAFGPKMRLQGYCQSVVFSCQCDKLCRNRLRQGEIPETEKQTGQKEIPVEVAKTDPNQGADL